VQPEFMELFVKRAPQQVWWCLVYEQFIWLQRKNGCFFIFLFSPCPLSVNKTYVGD